MADGIAEALLRRDRDIAVVGMCVLILLAWVWILSGAGMGMTALDMTRLALFPHLQAEVGAMAMGAAPTLAWGAGDAALMLAMWWVMMIAMMLPSAAPMVLLYARVSRHAQARGRASAAAVPVGWFVAGYLVAWLGFSLAAVALQALFIAAGALSGMMLWSESRWLSAAVLAIAALWQISPLKGVCLAHCRSPAEYLAAHWRPGSAGAFRMGAGHGAYCVGCCWALMALLFVGGVMNLVWIAVLAVLVLIEKLAPDGRAVGRAAGGLLLIWAVATLLV